MIVVMLVLLAATATAAFAVHSTGYELAAAGYERQAIQSQYAAETAIGSFMAATRQSTRPDFYKLLGRESTFCGAEPSISSGRLGYLILLDQLSDSGLGIAPVDRDALGGNRQIYNPGYFICVYDGAVDATEVAGDALAGGSGAHQQRRERITVTAYSSLRMDLDRDGTASGDVTTSETYGNIADTSWTREYHEVVSGARAHIITDPYMD
ncbi:MAG: hypothetical protein KC417_12835 [Myxococcales bacterium]|nr:hypothetical protein [Myxococcales bacterium]